MVSCSLSRKRVRSRRSAFALKVAAMPVAPRGEVRAGVPRGFAGALTKLYQLKGSGLSPSTR